MNASGGSDNELALVSKQQKRFVDLNVGDLLSELLGIYSRDLKKSFKYNRPLQKACYSKHDGLSLRIRGCRSIRDCP